MKGRDVSFLGMVVLVVGGLQSLSAINKPPLMPGDKDHTRIVRETSEQCLRCHQTETMAALEQSARHPAKWRDARTSCLLCHIPGEAISKKK